MSPIPYPYDGQQFDDKRSNEKWQPSVLSDRHKILVLTAHEERFGSVVADDRLEPTFVSLTAQPNHLITHNTLVLDLSDVKATPDLYIWLDNLYQHAKGQMIALIPSYSIEEKVQLLECGVSDYLDINLFNAEILYETVCKSLNRKTSRWQNFLQQVVDVNPNLIFVKNIEGQYVLVNQALAKRHNIEIDSFLGKTDLELMEGLGQEEAIAYMEQDKRLLEHKEDLYFPEEVIKDEKGNNRYLKTVKRVLFGENGEANYILGISMDITNIRQIEQELRQNYAVIENSPLIFFRCTTFANGEQLAFDFISNNIERYGFETEKLLNQETDFLQDICHTEDVEILQKFMRKAIKEGHSEFQIAFRIFTEEKLIQEKKIRWLEATFFVQHGSESETHKAQGFFLDITEKKNSETELQSLIEKIEYQASHDELTGLPNRRLFCDQLAQAMNYAQHSQKRIAVIFLKLEDFKMINDTYGNTDGDELLKQVIQRFQSITSDTDSIARIDGVKLAILINNLNAKEDIFGVAHRYLACLDAAFRVNGQAVMLNADIGVSCYPEDGESPHVLVNYAEIAMDYAKQKGKGNIRIFTQNLAKEVRELAAIESSLRLAVERGEFLLHYQPQISFDTGEMVGVEALLRWQRPEAGLVPPGKFIPVAEETLLIIDIGKWVLFESCAQAVRWHKQGFPITISVNVAAPQFTHENFVETIKLALASSGLEAHYLEIEVTEGVVMHNIGFVAKRLQDIRDLGVSVALDDFGTGFSSLKYLQNLPCDRLKIDRSFIMNIGLSSDDAGDRALVENIMRLGSSFNLEIIAEGIETQEQAEYLQTLGCGYAQGFYYARPVPAEEVLLSEAN